MESNLDKLFKHNKDMESGGIWFEVAEGVAFLVKRFGGANSSKVKSAMARHHKPYARLIEMGSLPDEKEKEVMTRVFVEACLLDWKGVQIDGKVVPYDKETAIKFFVGLPELLDSIFQYASDANNYREDLGNS